mmetsp:Transcript_56454/g.127605  ORF Transcript_56454/g.127605 Transcript_56454/m.127605 type:complete len:171 (-) Transcript_56454:167-679(-)
MAMGHRQCAKTRCARSLLSAPLPQRTHDQDICLKLCSGLTLDYPVGCEAFGCRRKWAALTCTFVGAGQVPEFPFSAMLPLYMCFRAGNPRVHRIASCSCHKRRSHWNLPDRRQPGVCDAESDSGTVTIGVCMFLLMVGEFSTKANFWGLPILAPTPHGGYPPSATTSSSK